MTFTDRLKTLLDRKALRFALVPVISQMAKVAGGGVSRITWDDGIWIHKTDAGYFAYHQPFVRLNMSRMDEVARVNFLWGYRPQPGDVVMDVGAGVGEETLTFSRAVGEQGRVICIEAHPRTFRCLEKLVQYNHLTNVTPIQLAVSEPGCQLTSIEDSEEYLANRSATTAGIPVSATTIDAIRQQLGLERIQFWKMNIEGAERFAIRGMAETLKHTEILCISCHDFLAKGAGKECLRTKSAVRQFLQQNGLHVIARPEASAPDYVRDQVWAYNRNLMNSLAG